MTHFMIGSIARHELRGYWRDGRMRWAAVITFVLLIAAALSGWSYERRLERERAVAQATEQARWLGQGAKNPHSAAHYGIYAFKQPSVLTAIDQGIEPFVGVGVWLEAHNMNQFVYRPAQDGTALTRFGELTAALIAQVLLPLLIVMLAFGAFAVERERGTLQQLASVGVSAPTLILGKLLGLGAAMAIVIGPALVLATVFVASHPRESPAADTTRLALLILTYLVYLVGWMLLALAVSARARTSRGALVVLLGLWVLCCLALPRAAVEFAAWLRPAPSSAAFRQELERDKAPSHSAERALQRRERIMKQYGVTRPEDLPIDWRGISLQEEEEFNYPIFDRHYDAMFDSYRAQDVILQAAGVLAPLLAAQSLSHALTGTDFEHHRRFVSAAEGQRRVMQKVLNEDVTLHDREGTDYRASREMWARIPPFEYSPPALSDVLLRYRLAILVLFIWLVGSGIAAISAVRALRP
jgi:ABC-2 type transport system permease protein